MVSEPADGRTLHLYTLYIGFPSISEKPVRYIYKSYNKKTQLAIHFLILYVVVSFMKSQLNHSGRDAKPGTAKLFSRGFTHIENKSIDIIEYVNKYSDIFMLISILMNRCYYIITIFFRSGNFVCWYFSTCLKHTCIHSFTYLSIIISLKPRVTR